MNGSDTQFTRLFFGIWIATLLTMTGYAATPERRGASRFDLELPLLLKLPSGSYLLSNTRNVSSQGVLIACTETVQDLMNFEFVMMLPREVTDTIDLRVSCKATTVRIQRDDVLHETQIAARIDSMELLSDADVPQLPTTSQ